MGLGFQELLIVLLIILLVFGGRKIPELARGLGRGMREFRKASRGEDEDEKEKTPGEGKPSPPEDK